MPGSGGPPSTACRALGPPLYPTVPLWSFATGALTALGRALSLAGVPQVVIRELPMPVSPPSQSHALRLEAGTGAMRCSPSCTPSLEDLLVEEEHEVSGHRRRARRKPAQDSAARTHRHSLRLAAKEDPFYVDATSKATRVKAA